MKLQQGFTLIELLVVVAVIGVLVAVIFVALDPAARFAQARDAVRQNDVGEILSAIKLYQVDNEGAFPTSFDSMQDLETYMVVYGSGMSTGCDNFNDSCTTPVSRDTNCVSISDLIQDGYLPEMPVSPTGEVVWDIGDNNGDKGSGYTISRDAQDVITVRACENEATESGIEASR